MTYLEANMARGGFLTHPGDQPKRRTKLLLSKGGTDLHSVASDRARMAIQLQNEDGGAREAALDWRVASQVWSDAGHDYSDHAIAAAQKAEICRRQARAEHNDRLISRLKAARFALLAPAWGWRSWMNRPKPK